MKILHKGYLTGPIIGALLEQETARRLAAL